MPDSNISKLDKKILIKFITGLDDKDHFLCDYQPKLNLLQRIHLEYLLYKKSQGTPTSYLTNFKEFYGRNFYVDKNVLIPRPETEQIIDILKQFSTNQTAPKSLLDLCAGSGCLGITASLEIDSLTTIDFIDISKQALKVAKKNSQNLNIKSQVNFIQSDYLQSIPANTHYDVILTNPPYIPINQPELVDKFTHNYEPHLALYSGLDGLDSYRQIFTQIQSKNISFNLLIGEFGFGQKKQLDIELRQKFRGCKINFYNDLQNIPRIFTLLPN